MAEKIWAEARKRAIAMAVAVQVLRVHCAQLILQAMDRLPHELLLVDPQVAHATRQQAYAAWQFANVIATEGALADAEIFLSGVVVLQTNDSDQKSKISTDAIVVAENPRDSAIVYRHRSTHHDHELRSAVNDGAESALENDSGELLVPTDVKSEPPRWMPNPVMNNSTVDKLRRKLAEMPSAPLPVPTEKVDRKTAEDGDEATTIRLFGGGQVDGTDCDPRVERPLDAAASSLVQVALLS